MNLAQVVVQQGDKNKVEDILQFIKLIYKSSRSLLELADEILSDVKLEKTQLQSNELNLVAFKETLEKLYTPQALNKKITYTVSIANEAKNIPFSKNKLLQITGNLISNAIKFTPEEGSVKVELRLIIKNAQQNVLCIMVEDSGVGIDSTTIRKILEGDAKSTEGTTGEKGYGFGLSLVKHLVESLNGTIRIESAQSGTTFFVELPQAA
jgi:signal transduction histidine kinase